MAVEGIEAMVVFGWLTLPESSHDIIRTVNQSYGEACGEEKGDPHQQSALPLATHGSWLPLQRAPQLRSSLHCPHPRGHLTATSGSPQGGRTSTSCSQNPPKRQHVINM